MVKAVEMIDLHNHILYGLDDGAKTIEESVEMCRISYQDGIKTIVATPHILPRIYKNDRSTILSKVQELNAAITKLGVRSLEFGVQNPNSVIPNSKSSILLNSEVRTPNSELSFKILPGADVHFTSDILQRYEGKEVVTVNDQGRYLLIEFAFQGIPYQAEEVLFQLMARGIIPIISHPERNMEIGQNPKRYYEMVRIGCLGQVTAMSLTGEFGSGIRRVAERLLKNRMVHIIASDAHSTDGRPPILSSAVRAAEKIVGQVEAQRMVKEYPQAVIEGRRPNVPDPIKL